MNLDTEDRKELASSAPFHRVTQQCAGLMVASKLTSQAEVEIGDPMNMNVVNDCQAAPVTQIVAEGIPFSPDCTYISEEGFL